MVDAKELHFSSPVGSEDIVRMNQETPTYEESYLREQFRLEDSTIGDFAAPGVIRGKGRLIMRSMLGITCIFEVNNLGATEIARYYPSEIAQMLQKTSDDRDRLTAYYDTRARYHGVVGGFRILAENIQVMLGRRKVVNINRAGELI